MNRYLFSKPLALAGVLGACAFAVPSASAMLDQRSPDARQTVQQAPTVGNDLRSPDARDAVQTAQQAPTVGNDLRSPDSRDAAKNVSLQSYPTPTVVRVSSSSGFDWGDAGIGAGGMLAAVVIAAGGTLLVTRRRSGASPAAS